MKSKLRVLPYVVLLLPLDVLVAFGILVASVCGSVTLWFTKHKGTKAQMDVGAGFSPRCTILIVNWDGKHLLAECLPSVVEAVQFAGGCHEIVVVDNGSTDGSVEFIRNTFPSVRILQLDRNYGFSGGNNRGIAQVSADVVVLLNNDMIVDRGFLQPLLAGFSDPSVFAVTSQIFFQDATRRREETGKTRARFERGFFHLWHDQLSQTDQSRSTLPVFWAGGGSCAIDRSKFLAIGGFDPLYEPFYLEDTDLSYQAWRRGWKSLLAPASKVVHKHRSTSRTKFGSAFVDNTVRRNQYLFVWKNVTSARMTLAHLVNLPRIHGRMMMFDQQITFETRAYVRAVRQLGQAMRKRIANSAHYLISDQQVLAHSQES
jgi:O-antigen biosynthesis protein